MSDQAEIERLRAALQGLMPFCAEDFPAHPDDLNLACVAPAYLRAYKAALEVLSGEPPSPSEPTAEPSPGLLMSMAMRIDHGLGVPGYYDSLLHTGGSVVLSHQKRLESALATARMMWEEVTGRGFYSPEKEAEYAARLSVRTSGE